MKLCLQKEVKLNGNRHRSTQNGDCSSATESLALCNTLDSKVPVLPCWNTVNETHGVMPGTLFQLSNSVISQGINICTARGQDLSFSLFINWSVPQLPVAWAVKATLPYVRDIRIWRSLGNIFHYSISLSSFLFFSLSPIPLHLSYCLFYQILACAMFIPLAALSWVKHPHLLPFPFVLPMLLKETFLLACISSLTSYPEQNHSQKTTSLTPMQLRFTTKLCIATASFSGTLSTVCDAHSLYTQPVRKRLHLSPTSL